MFDIQDIIFAFGYIGVAVVLFAESGVFLGFFLPGDSLIFTAGILASKGHFNIWVLLPLCAAAAILGDSFGYYFGKKIGPKIFSRHDSFFFNKKYIDKTMRFYAVHGKKTIILARFVPIVRTFAPILAGVGEMKYKTFFIFNVIGGLLWTIGFLSAGYFLGSLFPATEQYIAVILIGIILLSFTPIAYELWKEKRNGNKKGEGEDGNGDGGISQKL